MKDLMQRYWNERSPRERSLIISGAALLLAAFIYAYLWLPLSRDRERLMADLPRLRSQAEQMRAEAADIARLRAVTRPAAGDLKTALTTYSGSQTSRALPQVNAEGNDRARVIFASINADEWFIWISRLMLEHGVRVESAQIQALDQPGMIKANALLSSGN